MCVYVFIYVYHSASLSDGQNGQLSRHPDFRSPLRASVGTICLNLSKLQYFRISQEHICELFNLSVCYSKFTIITADACSMHTLFTEFQKSLMATSSAYKFGTRIWATDTHRTCEVFFHVGTFTISYFYFECINVKYNVFKNNFKPKLFLQYVFLNFSDPLNSC
jgi:hypothetical protein